MMMKSMESFLILYHLLEQCYEIDPGDKSSEELILSDFLSDIDPTLWADGRPMDQAIYIDWLKQNEIEHLDLENILPAIQKFITLYENRGFNFGRAKDILNKPLNDIAPMLKKAESFSQNMYKNFSYND
jgi:hypothetical protein